MKIIISTESAPRAIGPYSQGIKTGNLIFISGQIPVDPKTNTIAGNSIKEQTEIVLKNVKAVAEAAGSSIEKIVKTTCFLKDINDFSAFNEVYSNYFKNNCPARSTVGGVLLPKDSLVEIEAIAEL
jgi:2-iminobutanoate/2-iminopropanoate deaminase